jgi:glycogen synthase
MPRRLSAVRAAAAEPPRVLMTADAIGGVWTYAMDLAAGLSAAGVEVTLAVLGPPAAADQRRDADAIDNLTLVETGLQPEWLAASPQELARSRAGLAALAAEVEPQLLHLNSPALAGAGFAAPVLGACHSCVATWWSAARDAKMPEDFGWRAAELGKGMAACDALMAPSHAFAEATARTYGVEAPQVVHNGRPLTPPTAVTRERRVFVAGRLWDDGKNIGVLDRAAALLDAPILAAGPLEGPNGEQRSLRHARHLGRLSNRTVVDQLARSAVFASAAIYEPFGLSVLEAAQARCPLVLSNIPTFRELWDGAAVFVDPQDERAWAAALGRLLDDRQEARRLGAAARVRAERYTAAAMTEGVLALYRDLAPTAFARPLGEAAA